MKNTTVQSFEHFINTTFTKGATWFALFWVVFKELFAKYIFDDWDFVNFLIIAIILDTITGIWKSVKVAGTIRAINSRNMERLLVKCFLYFGLLVLTHILMSFTIHGEPNQLFKWIDDVIYGYMMGREALSILENVNTIHPGLVPMEFMNRIESFVKSGSLKDLTTPKRNEPGN